MRTSSHWFLLCAYSGRTVVYDGYKQTDETLMQSLVQEGQQRLEQMGLPAARPEMLPGRWQHDSWSCGWHLLQTIRLICGVISVDVQSSLPPLEHGALAKDINAVALTMGLEGCIDSEAGGEAGVEPTIEGEPATPRRQTTKLDGIKGSCRFTHLPSVATWRMPRPLMPRPVCVKPTNVAGPLLQQIGTSNDSSKDA